MVHETDTARKSGPITVAPALLGRWSVGVAFWATVNAEVEERLAGGTSRLRPQDWKSGEALWVVEVIAPFGGAEEMVKDLKAKVFVGREMKLLAVEANGKEVRTL